MGDEKSSSRLEQDSQSSELTSSPSGSHDINRMPVTQGVNASNGSAAAETQTNQPSESYEHGSTSSAILNGEHENDKLANGSKVLSLDVETMSEMDAVLDEESKRLDKVMSPSKKNNDISYKSEVIDKDIQYKRLIELLTKSQFYTEFLVKKLQQDPASSPKKGKSSQKKTGTQQVLEIAADIISNKKANEEVAVEEPAPKEAAGPGLTKELENGMTVPLVQPKLLTGACLRDYQVEGLNWLKLLFENGVNGILADEMGLGKTIQVISLVAHLVEKNVRGPFLIIGPLSTLPNWAIEFERFTPQIPVILYHGSEEKRAAVRNKMFQKVVVGGHKMYPVIITSFDYPLRDARVLGKMKWRYIIIDEGHRLKNHNSQLSRALRKYASANRLLLTGTPLHNSLSELWALLNFLVPEIFDDLEIFESWFRIEDLSSEGANEKLLEVEKKKKVLSTMHKILSPFMLRRVKTEVKLNLPPKKELIVYAPMTPIQLDLYKAVLDYNMNVLAAKEEESTVLETEDGKRVKRTCTTSKKFYNLNELFRLEDAMEAEGAAVVDNKTLVLEDKECKDYAIRVKMQNTGMMLRKIVNHPYLVQYPLEPGTPYARIDEDLVRTSGKLQVLDAMLTKLKDRGHKVLLFSTFTSLIDILEDYLSLRSFRYFRLDGSTSLDDRQIYIKDFNNDPEVFLFLISTRAGGLGINLASADTVIIFDSDWNPQVDLQAQDRCHRIGQTRPVVVYRFVTAGTVDERIVVRAAAKRKLEKIIIHKGNYTAVQKQDDIAIDLEELKKLLKSRDHQRVIHPNGFVFSDEELNDLLDRSDLIEGKATTQTADDTSLQERQFKEYYGYTGTKQDNGNEESKINAQIVDNDSNDTPCAPIRRSPIKSANFSHVLSNKSNSDDIEESSSSSSTALKDEDSETEEKEHSNSKGATTKKRKADNGLSKESKKLKVLQEKSELPEDNSASEKSNSTSSRRTRTKRGK